MPSETLRTHFEKEYNRESVVEKTYNSEFHYFNIFPWNEKFQVHIFRLLKKKKIIDNDTFELNKLHNFLDQKQINYNFKDGVSKIGSLFYETDTELDQLYLNFLKFLHTDIFHFDFYYQKNPTFRFHFPNADEEGANHYPRYHSDVQYGHSPREINLWFKLTKNLNNGLRIINLENSKKWYKKFDYNFDNFIKIASSGDKNFNDYGYNISNDLEIDEKTLFIFDSRCIHTGISRNKLDNTTRVSIDIRIIPVEEFEWKIIDSNPVYIGKGRMGAEFKPGGKFGYNDKSISEITI